LSTFLAYYRVGEGYIAITAEGQEVITWYNMQQQELRYVWREQEVPQLEAVSSSHEVSLLASAAIYNPLV